MLSDKLDDIETYLRIRVKQRDRLGALSLGLIAKAVRHCAVDAHASEQSSKTPEGKRDAQR